MVFKLPAKAGSATVAEKQEPPKKTSVFAKLGKPVEKATVATKPKGMLSFLKKGASAHAAMATEEAKREAMLAEAAKMWRFYLLDDETRKITFLDGELDAEGMLDVFMFYEHGIKLNGKFKQYICTSDVEECPLCARGDSRSTLVGVMTVIDHTPHKIQNGPNKGKIIKNTRKLFVAKPATMKLLTKAAGKRDGLAGCTFEVTRTGEKSPNVGSNFEFESKFESFDDIAKMYSLKIEDVMPADYTEELTYYTADELIALGAGQAVSGPGYSGGSFGKKAKVNSKALADSI